MLYTRRATTTQDGAFALKERLLFCLWRAPQPPRELMDALGMAKSNLALLAGKCIGEGLIVKERHDGDRRALHYSLTEKGRAVVTRRMEEIEGKFANVLTDEKERAAATENLDAAVRLLSYIP